MSAPPRSEEESALISIRRISLGGGFRYLMESVAVGDGAADRSSPLSRYYAESGTPPGRFLGTGLVDLDGGKGVAAGSQVTEEHLRLMLAALADPVSGEPVAGSPQAPAGAARSLTDRASLVERFTRHARRPRHNDGSL